MATKTGTLDVVTVHTVGHGARTLEQFLGVLATAPAGPITRLVDVRRYPGSRRHPQFGRDEMGRSLPAHGVAYDWRGDVMGGRRMPSPTSRHGAWRVPAFRAYADHMETRAFRDALAALLDDAAREQVAVMCAETLWWQCHRRLISDAVVARGGRVVHLLGTDDTHPSAQEHVLAPDLVRIEDGWPVYDVGCLPGL